MQGVQEFSQLMKHLLVVNSIYIIAGDFKYDLLKVTKNKPADVFADHVQIVIKATYIWITDR